MVEKPRHYMHLGTGYFTGKQSFSAPEKWTKTKGIPRAVKKKNNNNNKFIQYYHFVQVLAIKMTTS